MAKKYLNVIWGLALMLLGGLFLARQMDWIETVSPLIWLLFFAGMSVAFFVTYFVSGPEGWGWLFPACIFAGLAATMALDLRGVNATWVGAPVMAGVAAPFWLVYARNRRENWWALIPGMILTGITLVTLIEGRVAGEWIGTLVLYSVALPFLFIYLTDRKHWWALIPAGVLATVGIIPLLSMRANEDTVGGFILLLMAAPFVLVYLLARRNWWAIIPAGILASIGLALLVSSGFGAQPVNERLIAALMFAGWAITFGALWLARANAPTDWAKYPALALALLAVAVLALGENSINIVWPVIIIAAGVWILFNNFRQKRAKNDLL